METHQKYHSHLHRSRWIRETVEKVSSISLDKEILSYLPQGLREETESNKMGSVKSNLPEHDTRPIVLVG